VENHFDKEEIAHETSTYPISSYGGPDNRCHDTEEKDVAVCLLPGTELAFEKPVTHRPRNIYGTYTEEVDGRHKTAIFRQINKETRITHHDALEFPDGETVLLTLLAPDQHVCSQTLDYGPV
jgi:hypothetical protein